MKSREPARSASLIRLSRTNAVTPVRGAHGERTVTLPFTSVTSESFTQLPQPGSESPGARGGDAGHNMR